MGFLNKLFEKKRPTPLNNEKNHLKENSISRVTFGEATKILKFRKESEIRFQNQVIFLKTAIKESKYPSLNVFSMRKSKPTASFENLIVISGDKKNFRPMDNITSEEILQRVHPGKKMEDIWSDGVISDTADPGCVITDIGPFNNLRDEIKHALYSINEVLQEVKIEEKVATSIKCSNCGITLLVDTDVEIQYKSPMGSIDYIAERQRATDAVGVKCVLCNKGFCLACMKIYGKPHPQSGGLACLDCGGQLTQYRP